MRSRRLRAQHRTSVTRRLTVDDVRLARNGWTLLAVPLWAYRHVRLPGWSFFEPVPSAWRPLLRRLQRRADRVYAELAAECQRLREGLEAGTLTAADQSNLTFLAGVGINPLTPPARARVRPLRAREPQECWTCDAKFIGWTHNQGRYCSNHCAREARRTRPRASRAKPAESRTRTCLVCRERFTPSRGDARYCSGRCRVTAFRLAAVNAEPSVRG